MKLPDEILDAIKKEFFPEQLIQILESYIRARENKAFEAAWKRCVDWMKFCYITTPEVQRDEWRKSEEYEK